MRLLRVVNSRVLVCGCFVGVYETYGGAAVEIIDGRGETCQAKGHVTGRQLSTKAASSVCQPLPHGISAR